MYLRLVNYLIKKKNFAKKSESHFWIDDCDGAISKVWIKFVNETFESNLLAAQ